ncbi:MAG TPA: GH25 family lysozyme [Kofleriaceae bacterium]|nr:GH25 family lysozyme [Kofleriaceae bacterium]
MKGVDVSYYQGTIDWPAAKADGVEFAFTRVSDGLTFEDPKFETNWSAIKANGMLRGAYQFFRPNQDPIAQADLLLQKIGTLGPGDLPPVIDVEVDGGLGPSAVASAVRKWVDHVTAAIGRPPIIYTGFYFWRDQVGAPDLTTSPLWHAQYTTADCPNIAPPWTDWAFWQFTSSGRVAGIDGNVDTNRFNGTREQLEQLAGAQRPCGTIDAAGGTIDDGDDCFTAGGPSQYLRHISAVGEGDDLIWTHATEDAAESNYAQWNLVMAEAGRYRIEVSTPAAYAQSTQARYVVHAAGEDHEFVVDQTAADGFQVLGELDLAQGGEQFIHLGDNTGEPLANNVQLVFDAVRLTRIGPGEGSGSGDGDGDGDDDGSSSGCSAGGAGGLPLALLALGLVVRRRRR